MTQHCPIILKDCCRRTEHIRGDIAEVGVWRGDSALEILKATPTGKIYLYDTFCGMPLEMTTPNEYHKPGSWSDTSVELVTSKLVKFAERICIRNGVFPHTLKDADGPFKLVHIDCDQYPSTKHALATLLPRLRLGGLVVLDDYGCATTPGAKRAVDEYLSSYPTWVLERRGTRGILTQTAEALCLK